MALNAANFCYGFFLVFFGSFGNAAQFLIDMR